MLTGVDEGAATEVDALLDRVVHALGGARRAGQHQMARAVAAALTGDHHLLVQAGTGTGKSLAYLVPTVAHAVATGERVVVSTATLALQRQVKQRDLPLVADVLADRLARAPRVAVLKGWANYLCRHKVAGGYPEEEPAALFAMPGERAGTNDPRPSSAVASPPEEASGALGAQVLRLRAWADETATGDRDDLVPGVSDRAWRQVSVTAMECLGSSCPSRDECFPLAAREDAGRADVVVTNHAMLGIAAGGSPGVLPEHDVLVVDEAHELVDRVTAQATVELSEASVEAAARLARRSGGVPTAELDRAGEALGVALRPLPEGRLAGGLPEPSRTAVASVASAARTLLTALKAEAPGTSGAERSRTGSREVLTAQPGAGVRLAAAAMLALFETAERMAADDTSRDVLWCERGTFGDAAGPSRLRAAPLDVSGSVAAHLFSGRRAVLTSATLALGGRFDAVARGVGLRPEAGPGDEGALEDGSGSDHGHGTAQEQPAAGMDGEHPRTGSAPWRGLDVGSPFDYSRQAILYVARGLPLPTAPGAGGAQLAELEQLVSAAGGGTLGLFSSRRAATAAAEALRERVPFPILCQGDDQLPTLVQAFTADDAACLFGTLSLWQGVDVPGSTCRLVVIDRIPFPRPDDPVRSARAERVDRTGGNGFMAVSAGHAALLLAQGAGRLIRTTGDRGVVAILDPRLVTARYGEFLLRSMPPMWRTVDPKVARAALRRLAPA